MGIHKFEAFTWNGKTRDGKFEGVGKFKSNGYDEKQNTEDICYQKTKVFGEEIINITGWFEVTLIPLRLKYSSHYMHGNSVIFFVLSFS